MPASPPSERPPEPSSDPSSSPGAVPPPLLAAASLAGGQGLLLVGLGVLELASLSRERLSLGVGVAVFFLGLSALVLAAARALQQGAAWGRGPVLLVQLVQLGVAWTNRSELPMLVTGLLVVTAVAAVLGVIHPASVKRLDREP